jgi:hypothetical protein
MKPRHPRGFSLRPPRLAALGAAAIWPRDGPVRCRGGRTGATMGEQEFGSVLGETTMSVFRFIAGVVGLAFVAAASTAVLGIGAEVRAELAPSLAKENPPAMAWSDGWACAREPWPYGCQWQAPPVKRVFVRPSRPS